VLTGGSGGVAVSCVRRLAREGGRFLLADVAEDALAKVAGELAAEGIGGPSTTGSRTATCRSR
jgi:NAD(P)-dependent dehydrogenase (short-subunit alcohol dehydrogenase family)